jgi:hypothetical protein
MAHLAHDDNALAVWIQLLFKGRLAAAHDPRLWRQLERTRHAEEALVKAIRRAPDIENWPALAADLMSPAQLWAPLISADKLLFFAVRRLAKTTRAPSVAALEWPLGNARLVRLIRAAAPATMDTLMGHFLEHTLPAGDPRMGHAVRLVVVRGPVFTIGASPERLRDDIPMLQWLCIAAAPPRTLATLPTPPQLHARVFQALLESASPDILARPVDTRVWAAQVAAYLVRLWDSGASYMSCIGCVSAALTVAGAQGWRAPLLAILGAHGAAGLVTIGR